MDALPNLSKHCPATLKAHMMVVGRITPQFQGHSADHASRDVDTGFR